MLVNLHFHSVLEERIRSRGRFYSFALQSVVGFMGAGVRLAMVSKRTGSKDGKQGSLSY